MSLWQWIFGSNHDHGELEFLGSPHVFTILGKLTSDKVALMERASKNLKKPLVLEEIREKLQKIVEKESSLLVKAKKIAGDVPYPRPLEAHLIGVIERLIQLNENERGAIGVRDWETISALVRADAMVIFGSFHHDWSELQSDIEAEKALRGMAHGVSVERVLAAKRVLDLRVMGLREETDKFTHVYSESKEAVGELVVKYRALIADAKRLMRVQPNGSELLQRALTEMLVTVQAIDPVHKDPHIDPYADIVPPDTVSHILDRLLPCHLVLSKARILAILSSGKLMSREQRQLVRDEYLQKYKEQGDALFLSMGGPYEHLPILDKEEVSLIVFKKEVLNFAHTIYPRDSGAYPEMDVGSLTKKGAKERVQELLSRRQFPDVASAYKYLFRVISQHGLRRNFQAAIVSQNIKRKGVSMYPEIIIRSEIPLSLASQIIMHEKVYYSKETVALRSKWGKLIIPSADPISDYWKIVGLSEFVQD